MTIEDLLIKVLAPTLTVVLIVYDRWRKIKEARAAEKVVKKSEDSEYQRLMYYMQENHKRQVEYLQTQLDECLDASRPTRPK